MIFTDQLNRQCKRCQSGTYKLSLDVDTRVYCPSCNYEVERYVPDKNEKKQRVLLED